MSPAPSRGFTWIEVLVVLVVLVVLALLAVPSTAGSGLSKGGPMTQVLSHMKQLHLATGQMALDFQTSTEDLPDWTCRSNQPISTREWHQALVTNGYLTQRDLTKLLTAKVARPFWFDRYDTNAIQPYAVTGADPGDTVFLTTRNWHGISTTKLSGETFGRKGMIRMWKNGAGMIVSENQLTNGLLIGSGGQFNYRSLR